MAMVCVPMLCVHSHVVCTSPCCVYILMMCLGLHSSKTDGRCASIARAIAATSKQGDEHMQAISGVWLSSKGVHHVGGAQWVLL